MIDCCIRAEPWTKTLLGDKLGFGPTACAACMWGEGRGTGGAHSSGERLRFTH